MILSLLGGVGLFLLGMALLTDGLKALAGAALRPILTRFVGSPLSGMVAGAGITALVQSSSATTVATIGFVSAGLMTFHQALGVIFGANIGTTSTAWIVSLLGFKVSVSSAAFPMIFLGALLRLLGRDRTAGLGTALAGFGLLFYGLDVLQHGMAGFAERVTPESFPDSGVLGRLLMVGLGLVMTVVMQSSSAAIATTLTALDSGAIDFTQAAAMVIGQNVGTTVTAAIACIGATSAARQTAVAHVLFNAITGVVAFVILPWFVWAVEFFIEDVAHEPDVVALAAFHTVFNVLGVVLLFPLLRSFARLVRFIVPDAAPAALRTLDLSIAEVGPVGIEAARRALADAVASLIGSIEERIRGVAPRRHREQPIQWQAALEEFHRFLARLTAGPQNEAETRAHLDLVHALDHFEELTKESAIPAPDRRILSLRLVAPLQENLLLLFADVSARVADLRADAPALDEAIARRADEMAEMRRRHRRLLLEEMAAGRMDPQTGDDAVDGLRWLDAVGYHTARLVHHLGKMR